MPRQYNRRTDEYWSMVDAEKKERIKELLRLMKEGNPIWKCALYLGVSEMTCYRWLRYLKEFEGEM